MYCSLFYNINVAASITAQGRTLVSSAAMCFEMFLSNNVKFMSLDEVIAFIDNVTMEVNERKYNDYIILNRMISREECFQKIVMTCGFEWIPDEEELQIIWDIVSKLDQVNLNRLYYKNNLYEFMENSLPTQMFENLLWKLDKPFMDPNKAPKEIKDELDQFTSLIMEYVYYHHAVMNVVDRSDNMIKNVCAISDTDSTIISLDAWYRYNLEKVKGKRFNILKRKQNLVDFIERDEFGDYHEDFVTFEEPELDYDFYSDEVIEMEHKLNLMEILPQDNLRYSIINILAYILDKVINDYMIRFCKASNSYDGDCLIIMKNEFLFARALLTNVKKNYATKQELQEGHIVPEDERLDLKGLAIDKSSMDMKTRKQLKKVLYEDILNSPEIDQVKILKDLAIIEKDVYQSLASGSKEYYKPSNIKSMSSYDKPMRIQGIKAAEAYNAIKDDYLEMINFEERNAIDIVKVNINGTTIEKIRDTHPEIYEKMLRVVGNKTVRAEEKYETWYKGEITALAIPKDVKVPDWVIPFIDYNAIINDKLTNFPLESIGINRGGKNTVNYTNIISL